MNQPSYNKVFAKTEKAVTQFFEQHGKKNLTYHNLQHTTYVVHKTLEIAAHYPVTDEQLMVLYVAAWFHDTGYLLTDPKKHELKSAEVLKNMAVELGLTHAHVEEITRCILATRYPRKPVGLLEEIICDADTFNLGTKDFWDTNKRIFREVFADRKEKLSKLMFDQETIRFMEVHQYYTAYCRQFLKQGKAQNKKQLQTTLLLKPVK
ncbi:MAG TPA: HD domain-containing protein [Ferruginibacter sp.]|nr:HD domain-containing protein [Ferruginibacter sp.]HRN78894.1 HD domain-containing protein [Ferruginibacter sp.]HRO17602.1 HD domain-containing protein [Ferruginibacter sp.]HRQ19748.1 HD domain-containing protein [Ferruginibacter sp.]